MFEEMTNEQVLSEIKPPLEKPKLRNFQIMNIRHPFSMFQQKIN